VAELILRRCSESAGSSWGLPHVGGHTLLSLEVTVSSSCWAVAWAESVLDWGQVGGAGAGSLSVSNIVMEVIKQGVVLGESGLSGWGKVSGSVL